MSAPCPTFGFVVRAAPRSGSDADKKMLNDDLVAYLETHGLCASHGRRALEYSISREGSQATNADRELVLAWADKWMPVADIDVSDLVDLSESD
jgi:hypothetical protein